MTQENDAAESNNKRNAELSLARQGGEVSRDISTGDTAQDITIDADRALIASHGQFPAYEGVVGDFPVQALPGKIRGAVIEVCKNNHVPAALVAQAALGAVSIALQDLIMVDRGRVGGITVCSLYLLAVADPTARKTRADDLLTAAIKDTDEKARDDHDRNISSYEIQKKNWQDEEKSLSRAYINLKAKADAKLKKSVKPGEAEQDWSMLANEVFEKLHAHRATPPEKPQLHQLIYDRVAISDLERSLFENWPAAGLFSNDAGDILLRRTDADMARLDRLWEGQNVDVVGNRKGQTFYVRDPRLTMSLMIQPYVFERFLEKKGKAANGMGFMSRTLLSRPYVTYGDRLIDPSEPILTKWQREFSARLRSFLDLHAGALAERSRRKVLRFASDAQSEYVNDYNRKESETAKGRKYYYERFFVGRYSEHVARLAALFHVFEYWESLDDSLDISIDTLHRAIQVAEWYLGQYRKVFNPDEMIEVDAHLIMAWIYRYYESRGWSHLENKYGESIPKSFVSQYGPNHLRDKKESDRREAALLWLQQKKWVAIRSLVVNEKSTPETITIIPPPRKMGEVSFTLAQKAELSTFDESGRRLLMQGAY